ncbi:MAG: hypothetical protein D6713_08615 [Deltaproteobacteria bacterium]|nr:MAG: hypothetical protein D6713_08615 [Deltaproteobacteria bacterium]
MKKRTALITGVFALALCLIAGPAAWGKSVAGVEIPEKVTVQGKELSLVGAGIRTKTIFRVKVYIGALYMENPSRSREEIISSDQVKRMVMHFLYKKVGKEKIIEGWNEGFEKNSRDRMKALKERIGRFNSFFDSDLKRGDEVLLTYIPGTGTEVTIKGEKKGVIEGKDFADALFAIWFGPHPADEDMMEEILAGK